MRNLFLILCLSVSTLASGSKPRVIATTDGEYDDLCSMVRFLLYANEWDVEGLIYCSSVFHWHGHAWEGVEWIEDDIDAYAGVYDQLIKHSPDYPTPDALRAVTFVGNIDSVGEMEKETPGSKRIVDILLDKSDDRPVWLQAWGGTNTIARALKTIQEKHPKEIDYVSRKARIYIILDQDRTYNEYVRPNWPKIQVLYSRKQFNIVAYDWGRLIPQPYHAVFERSWMIEHITENHGPLCDRYPSKHFGSEGDSPAFMHVIPVGLRQMESPSWGGWGGRFLRQTNTGNHWPGAKDKGMPGLSSFGLPIYRWAIDFQNDFAARADWCVNDFENANHPPDVSLDHAWNPEAAIGATVKLSAKGTTDPDGDSLEYNWWVYPEPGAYQGELPIQNAGNRDVSFVVPLSVREGDSIHIICTVRDNGSPRLARYARVVVRVKGTDRVAAGPLLASSARIARGESTTLTWSTLNATKVLLDEQKVSANGDLTVSPDRTTTFLLKATGKGKPVTRRVTVEVYNPVLTGVEISPPATHVLAGSRTQFSAHFVDQKGNSFVGAAEDIRWSLTGTGSLSGETGTRTTLHCGSKPGKITLALHAAGRSATLDMEVVKSVHVKLNCGEPGHAAHGWDPGLNCLIGGQPFSWSNPVQTGSATDPAPPPVYTSVIHSPGGSHTYSLPASKAPDGSYLLRIHTSDQYGGERNMFYVANGDTLISNYNPSDSGLDKVVIKEFRINISGSKGLTLLCGTHGNDVFEAGIEVISCGGEAGTKK